jgi:hypothetical protein
MGSGNTEFTGVIANATFSQFQNKITKNSMEILIAQNRIQSSEE